MREGLGHYRTTFCSGPTGTRVGDNWLISSFEVGDAHVSIQIQAKRALLESAKDMGIQTLKAKQG